MPERGESGKLSRSYKHLASLPAALEITSLIDSA